ncbi:MAG: hypothetical protein E6767_08530 [Dysgonomonas sp.]|nr:hypothetical protein [Dysgonomonas sp.]
MKPIICLLFIFITFHIGGFAQKTKQPTYMVSDNKLYVVNDNDGWINLREEPNIKSNALCTIPNYKILRGINGKHKNWIFVQAHKNSIYGFIHISRLIEIPQGIINKNHADNLYMEFEISRITTIKDAQKNHCFKVYFCDKEMTYGFIADKENNVVASLFSSGFGLLDKYHTHHTEGYEFDKDSLPIRRYSYSIKNDNTSQGGFYIDIQGNSLLKMRFRPVGKKQKKDNIFIIIDDQTLVYSKYSEKKRKQEGKDGFFEWLLLD